MVVEEENKEKAPLGDDLVCTACEMLVVWVRNQLKQQETKERVLDYMNQVIYHPNATSMFPNQRLSIAFRHNIFLFNSSARVCPVQWENQQSTAIACRRCQMLHSLLEVEILPSPLSRSDFRTFLEAIIYRIFSGLVSLCLLCFPYLNTFMLIDFESWETWIRVVQHI